MGTILILIRHGETAWNREKLFRGTQDVPLNHNGRAQATALGETLSGRRIDVVYSSPLSRAVETARIALRKQGLAVQTAPALQDIDFGEWTGRSEEEVARKWPLLLSEWRSRPDRVTMPGGNSLKDVKSRAFGFLTEAAQEHAGKTVALFAHRVVNKVLILAALRLELDRFPYVIQDNCCINELEWDGREFILRSLNDVCHIVRNNTEVLVDDF